MTPRAAQTDSGFSLLEVMVALAVFSLGALALLNVLGEGTRTQVITENRAIARIIAENQLVSAMALSQPPETGTQKGTEEALLRNWEWEMTVAPTDDTRILRIDVRVREEGQTQTIAELSSFRSSQ